MPTKKTKRSKAQSGGWWYEQSDPIFGKSNKWLATQAGYIDPATQPPTATII